MTDHFASVAEHYDLMIDWPARLAREQPFFTALFTDRPVKRVLDVGCGTGHHTRLFAALGAQAIGLEPSAPMLARAGALTTGDNPRFVAGGFADLPAQPGPFDLIAVLGNSLAYVQDAEELTQTLLAMRELLAPAGRLLLQGVNYDSLNVEKDRWLRFVHRQLDNREYIYLREYRLLDSHVEFTLIILQRDGDWQQTVERSIHLPITGMLLKNCLLAAGFQRFELYGDYTKTPYQPETSANLIAVAEV